MAQAADTTRPRRFIDVGCGGGTKSFAAASFFEESHGLELNQGFVDSAKSWMKEVGANSVTIMQGDALLFDDYGSYDVIYFYRPFRDNDMQTQLEKRMCEQARPGTIIIAPLTAQMHRFDTEVCLRLVDSIFVTGMDFDSGRALIDRALTIGPDVGIEDRELDRRLGFWLPIAQASRRNGFEIV